MIFLDELQLRAGNPCEASRQPIATVSTQGVAQANATSAVPPLDTAGIVVLDELPLQAGNPCGAPRPPIATVSTQGAAPTNATSAVPELDSAAIVFLDELRLQAGNHCEVTFVDFTDEFFSRGGSMPSA